MPKLERGELVVVRIKRIMPYGAYCELLEFPEYQGFLHISEISTSWVKNIHHHIKEGQTRVARVLEVDKAKKIVEISLKRVKEEEKKLKMEEYNNERMAIKLINAALKKAKSRKKIGTILRNIYHEYESAYDFLLYLYEEKTDGEESGLPKKAIQFLKEEVKERFKPKEVKVMAEVKLTFLAPDGIKRIKEVFRGVPAIYLGGGMYRISMTAEDYKSGNKKLKKILEEIERKAKKLNGKIETKMLT